MRKLDPKVRKSIEIALRAGNKMHAIRLYMEAVSGSTMAEAKSEIESILTGVYVTEIAAKDNLLEDKRSTNPLTSDKSIMAGISYLDRLKIAEELFAGNKLEAIKIFRRVSDCKELIKAKKIVEIFAEELYKVYPDRFKKPPKRLEVKINPLLAGVIIAVLILLVISAVYFIILWK